MLRILITGATGNLGQALLANWRQSDYSLRAMSRQPAPTTADPAVQWVQADIETGSGLAEALRDVDIVVNCASSPREKTYEVDVLGTKRLMEQAKLLDIKHVLHISIVGIDRIPTAYYQHKLAAEQVVIDSGAPYSILRITQFHSLIDNFLQRALQGTVLTLPTDVQFQTIDITDVAAYMLPLLTSPGGRLADLGGPQILTLGEMARLWLEAKGIQRQIVHSESAGDFPVSMQAVEGYRSGANTVHDNRYGSVTWSDYLHK
jgi:uncharacterized protein YbjT (DUF2867 family)